MRALFLCLLFLASAGVMPGVISGAADAQKGLSTGPNLDGIDNANRLAENQKRKLDGMRKDGVAALQKEDFAGAEKIFARMADQNPTTTDSHYLLGVARLAQQNWTGAKEALEVAVTKDVNRPEPKALLGVAYLRLNDAAGAMKQREELAGLGAKCNGCPDAPRIAENLALLDRAIAARAPTGSSAAPQG